MGVLEKGTSFGDYIKSFPGLGLGENASPEPPKPQKSAKELIAQAEKWVADARAKAEAKEQTA